TDGLPTVVPALRSLGQTMHFTGTFPLDGLGDVPRDVLGYGDGAVVVLEGELGVTLAGSAAFDPATTGWSISATLPRIPAPDIEYPFLLELDPSARFTLTI